MVLPAFAPDRASGSSCNRWSMSACRLPASSLTSALRMGMTSVHSTAMIQQLMPGIAYNFSQFNLFLLAFN